jgi:hypothetical protein
MTRLDDFFTQVPDVPGHPRLRNWQARLKQAGASATLEVFRPITMSGQAPAEMNVEFTENGRRLPLEAVAWDDDLNTGLIRLGVRAVNPDQEAQRFALGLRAAMRQAEREFGDGYFNGVLVDFLSDSDLTSDPEIVDVLKHAYALKPAREGKAQARYTACREMIADAISGRARELTGPLHYLQEEAKGILVRALARYLDERFSVSSRRRLGLL